MIEETKERGYERVYLWTEPQNRDMYKHFGIKHSCYQILISNSNSLGFEVIRDVSSYGHEGTAMKRELQGKQEQNSKIKTING